MAAISFLPGAIPEPAKLPRRRLAGAVLALAALAAGGAMVYDLAHGKPAPLQRPGPRRVPPSYRPRI